ncbi:hypothetical protein [Tenacibaculum sp.]|uniref:hypothetical protein n=1 Tax=Tenacibaculum sp. TaxID=1906242 RepID=UPI003D0C8175
MKFKKYYYLLLLVSFSLSCVKNIDIDQVDTYDLTPKYIASLVYFKMPVLSFFDSVTGSENIKPIIDESNISIMEEQFIQDKLKEVIFDFEVTNPFSRDIYFSIQFLDETDNITYSINPILIKANTSNLLHKETIVIENTPQFLDTRKIRVSLQLSVASGTPLDMNDSNEFIFKSAGTFTFKI